MTDHTALATGVLAELEAAGATLAVAESLTGGLVTATLVAVPGASAVLRGGVVAYAADLKHVLLGVDPELLADVGAVDPEVATAMAVGVRVRLGATWGIATTGVAGPDPQDGQPVGTVHLAAAGPASVVSRRLDLPAEVVAGGRTSVRNAAVEAVLELLRDQAPRFL